jgi:phytoene synthase
MSPQAEESCYAAAQAICQRHARSFYFASHFLPRARRRHAYAVYAYCRLMDDAIDVPTGPLDERFGRLLAQLDDIYAGRLEAAPDGSEATRALRAFAQTVRACDIPRQYFLDLATGCRMDLTIKRYETWEDLDRYCYHVAGVVGLMMCRVLGVSRHEAESPAIAMGNAMQLTNILRDVRDDWDRGRIYLPRQEMQRCGYTEADLAARRNTPALEQLLRRGIQRTHELYAHGAGGLTYLPDDGSRLTASVMAAVYGGILDAIEHMDYDVLNHRAHLTTPQKLLRLPLALRLHAGMGWH